MTGNEYRKIIVQKRDRHLLGELSLMRLIDREQAKVVAQFNSTTRANTRLLALARAGLLRRFFLGTVGGARKSLYSLSRRGSELVGIPYNGPLRGQDEMVAADLFAEHQLAINDIYCFVKYRPIPGGSFTRWIAFREPVAQNLALIPDGYFEIASSSKNLAVFLEVDLGNETRAVWQRKVRGYIAYASSGNFASQFGQTQFRVLAVASSEGRLLSLRGATAAITEKIFWFTTIERIKREGFWSLIWERPTGDARLALL